MKPFLIYVYDFKICWHNDLSEKVTTGEVIFLISWRILGTLSRCCLAHAATSNTASRTPGALPAPLSRDSWEMPWRSAKSRGRPSSAGLRARARPLRVLLRPSAFPRWLAAWSTFTSAQPAATNSVKCGIEAHVEQDWNWRYSMLE